MESKKEKKMIKWILLFSCFVTTYAHSYEQLVLNNLNEHEPTFTNRYSLMLGVNPSLVHTSNITNFTLSYGKKYDHLWLDTNLLITKGIFRELSENNVRATGATDFQLADQRNFLITAGVGVAIETRYAQTLLPFENIYELVAANITYNYYKEDFSDESFTGPGLIAKFSLYNKINDYVHVGGHFNYNLAVVKRSERFEGESNSARSLTLGFITVGLDLSFYL